MSNRSSSPVLRSRLALVVVAAVVILVLPLPSLAVAPPGPPSVRTVDPHGPTNRQLDAYAWTPSATSEGPRTPLLGGTPTANNSTRNVLVDVPCDSGGNAEVESAYDPAASVLYDAWIGCGGIGFARSLDRGYSFQAATPVPGSTNGSSWDPAIAVAPNGTVFVSYMVQNATGPMPMVAWSTDHGASFAGESVAFLPNPHEFGDRDFLAVGPNGTVYLTWDYSPNSSLDQIGCASGGSCYFVAGDYNILLVRSSDGGRNWSDPVPVSAGYPNGGAPCGPLLVAPDGAVDVLYEGYRVTVVNSTHLLGPGLNYFARSTDGGASFSAPVPVSNLTFPTTDWWINGALSQDASGTLYATFDSPNATNDTAYVALSRDQGTTWSDPVRVNPDSDPAAHIMVEAAGGGNGTAYLAWMSNNSSAGWSTFETVLSGNGSVVGPVIRISDQAGVPGYWVGDTIGVSFLGDGEVAVSWSYGVTVSSLLASQVFSATIGEPLPGPPTITAVRPGIANATIDWAPSAAGGPSDAFEVAWGIEGQFASRSNVSGSDRSITLYGLVADAHYVVEVAAVDSAGVGPSSAPRGLVLTAWSVLTGTVTPHGAEVSLDHQPLSVLGDGTFSVNTTIGAHLITSVAFGFLPYALPVTLPWNASAFEALLLSPAPGAVQGSIAPYSANVTWDGVRVSLGLTGGFRFSGPAGSVHTLNASLVGYLPRGEVVTIPQNATFWLNFTLLPRNGTIELEVLPVGATVTVDGVPVPLNADGFANASRPPGVYAVRAEASGYLPFSENVSVSSTPQLVFVNLTRAPMTGGPAAFPGGTAGEALLGVLAVVGVAVVLASRSRRRSRPSHPSTVFGDAAPPFADASAGSTEGPSGPRADPP